MRMKQIKSNILQVHDEINLLLEDYKTEKEYHSDISQQAEYLPKATAMEKFLIFSILNRQ